MKVEMPGIEVLAGKDADFEEYARIPIAFEVRHVMEVSSLGPALHRLTEREIGSPYVKDYDALPEGSPADLKTRFDVSKWGVLAASLGHERVGGAVLALDTPEVDMLEARSDLAVVWDLRVAPTHRKQGIGSALWKAAESWARARGCRELKVETQNVNVPACRFYARQGCVLRCVRRGAYAELPDEIQLHWYESLGAGESGP